MKNNLLFWLVFWFSWSAQAQGNLDLEACLYPFYHGVASGDPLEDRVIIWTRVTPDSLNGAPVVVSYKVATDTSMTNVVAQGSVLTNDSKDYTVKVDVTGLQAETYYFYEFTALDRRSATGRTKTAPSSTATADTVRFGIVSCANLEAGFFNVYKVMNERNDMDAVLCLGDYIYEYETGGYSPNPSTQRFWEPTNEISSLADYRMRYSTYHLDADLRRNHQLYPWICIWDDHESANDSWKNGAENHTDGSEGAWLDRKSYSKQAYFEWLPIRETGATDPYQIYRTIHYGPLCDLIMLDTRLHGRDEQDGTTGSTVESDYRELLGADQRAWMDDELLNSTAQWKILGQQVMMAPLEVAGIAVNGDQWDGYPAERERLYDFVSDNYIENLVVITGDIHTSWANDLPGDSYNSSTGSGAVGVEFVAPSVTSPGFDLGVGSSLIQSVNPHMKYVDLSQHGFIILDINQSRIQGDWYYVNTIDSESNSYTSGASYYCTDQTAHMQSTNGVALPSSDLTDVLKPNVCPRTTADFVVIDDVGIPENDIKVLSLYPNPANDFFMIQYYMPADGIVSIEIINQSGQLVNQYQADKPNGLYIEKYPTNDLKPGLYFVKIQQGNQLNIQKLVVQ